MTNKKITFPSKPNKDKWVEERIIDKEAEPMKRLTIDIPESLHIKIKSTCAQNGNKMVDELRELLLKKYGKE